MQKEDAGVSRTEPDDSTATQESIRVETREQFDEAVEELFWTGRSIKAPSLERLADWDVDIEDDEGRLEGL